MEIKSKGVYNIPSSLRAEPVQLNGEVSDDQCRESYLKDQDLLWQIPGATHTFKRGSYVSGGNKKKKGSSVYISSFPKEG